MEPGVDESALPGGTTQPRSTIIYCRFSSSKQVPDLERQQALLSSAFPGSEVITDVGSGLNYNKPGLSRLEEMVCREQIGRIVVTFKDRFLRFGYELFEKMCKSVTSKSWFSLTNNAGSKSRKTWNRKNSRRTSSPSSTSSLPDAMERKPGSCGVSDESKPETKESPNSILKTRLYRTPEQKVLLKKMFGTHRTINNKLVEVSKGDCYQFFNIELDQKYMGISQKHSLTEYLPDYHLEVPEEVINETYRDFTKAIKSSRALYNSLKENGKKTTFPSLKFKSRKDNTTSIEVRTRTLSSPATGLFRMLPSYFGFKKTEGMKVLEAIPETNYSIRLQMTRESEFYICTPRVKAFAQTQSGRVCAIDPGVRDFITLYDPGGLTLGVTDGKDKIFQCCLSIDRLQSKLSREHRKRYRYRLKKLIYRMYQRIKCMVKDMHQKCSKWLSINYDEVLLPKFATSEMTQKQKRISSKTSGNAHVVSLQVQSHASGQDGKDWRTYD